MTYYNDPISLDFTPKEHIIPLALVPQIKYYKNPAEEDINTADEHILVLPVLWGPVFS